MSSSNRSRASKYNRFFFWTGLILAVACFALIAARNTALVYPVEHTALPLSWAFGAAAMFQFLVADLCHQADQRARRANEADSQRGPAQPQGTAGQQIVWL